MKKNSYIILALAGMLSMNSCNDDEFLPGNPSMEIKAENADALFGDSLPFTIKASGGCASFYVESTAFLWRRTSV